MLHHKGIVGIALFMEIFLAACTTISTRTPEGDQVTMNEKEFAIYVEHVFRHHNHVLNELITSPTMAQGVADSDEDDVADAEMDMIRTCDPLNEVVAAEAEQRHASFSTLMKLADVVPECETLTRELEILLHPPTDLPHKSAGDSTVGPTAKTLAPPPSRSAP
ncbi:MAG: hypothetical protein PHT19_06720 [Methylococcus sp.]|nr:hypothetical protein [Methylococcus sp.]